MGTDHHADTIWHGGIIATGDPQIPSATALAIRDGRIIAVGSDARVMNLTGPGTKPINLGGKFVMPGLVESHAHALWGACRDLFDVFVGYQASFDQLMQAVEARTNTLTAGALVFGGPWRPDMRGQMGPSPRGILDAIAPAHPVALQDVTQHALWCNTRALELAGITATSPDIAGGVIERDPATRAPTGILAETACGPVKQLMSRSPQQLADATRHFVRYFNAMGITAFKEPMAFEADLQAYKSADERGELTVHMAAHIVRTSPYSPDPVPYDTIERLRRDHASPNVRTDFAKLFLDGVAPSFTASFLEPYLASSSYKADPHDPDATLLMTPDDIAQTVAELDRRGFVVKMHAVGDNAVRKALDGIEEARRQNGDSGLRHEVSHCPFVTPEDIPRFTALDAVAEMSPKLWFPNPGTAGQLAVLGRDRVERCHPVRDLLEAGAEVIYASDWPAAAPDANPWTGLAGMISRRHPKGLFPGTVGADQAITLDQALPIFTLNGARSLGMEAQTGTLTVGKWADFIILDKPLDTLSPEEIGAMEVVETRWKGQCVHER